MAGQGGRARGGAGKKEVTQRVTTCGSSEAVALARAKELRQWGCRGGSRVRSWADLERSRRWARSRRCSAWGMAARIGERPGTLEEQRRTTRAGEQWQLAEANATGRAGPARGVELLRWRAWPVQSERREQDAPAMCRASAWAELQRRTAPAALGLARSDDGWMSCAHVQAMQNHFGFWLLENTFYLPFYVLYIPSKHHFVPQICNDLLESA